MTPKHAASTWPEIAAAFLKLGCMSFGGPVAHLGYFREEFVRRRAWLTDEEFGDLVALCQFLPGPASSQTVVGLGLRRGGWGGAAIAAFCFTAPSAALMIFFAYRVAAIRDWNSAGWLHGLKLVSVSVVAQAVWSMARKLCPDWTRASFAGFAEALALLFPGSFTQIILISVGALGGWLCFHRQLGAHASPDSRRPPKAAPWLGAIATWIGIAAAVAILPMLADQSGNKNLAVWAAFFRSGALVFGGGHVVLPLLRAELVPTHWISDNLFLAGYGAAQAVPGPLFTFAAFLGTVIQGPPDAWAGGIACLIALFLPGWLLIATALPVWDRLRNEVGAQAALRGANATVVGILLAALYNPIWRQAVFHVPDVAFVVIAFLLLQFARCPAWLIVVLAAAAGQWVL